MSDFKLAEGDEYDIHCGEVFLSLNGCILFHCTLCDNKYKGINEYGLHVIELHYDPPILETDEISTNNVGVEKDGLDALQEVEIPLSVITKEQTQNQVLTAVLPVLDENEPDLIKWEEEPKSEEEVEDEIQRPPIKKQKILDLPSILLAQKSAVKVKPQSEAEKLRIANQEALLSMGDQPTYKQPPRLRDTADSERKHKCNFCGFAFKNPVNLFAHIKRHLDIKNYQCAYCPRMFSTRNEIDAHSRRHTGERPFVCEYENCDKAFFTRSELNIHKKRHLNQRDHKCEICDRSFFDKGRLTEHMGTHTKERNHECIVCHRKFSRRKALHNHMKLHENKQEYECKLCNASFNQRPGLNSHMKSKHKEYC